MPTIVSQVAWEQLVSSPGPITETIHLDIPSGEVLRINASPQFDTGALGNQPRILAQCQSVVEVAGPGVIIDAADHSVVYARTGVQVNGQDYATINASDGATVLLAGDFAGRVRTDGAHVVALPHFDVQHDPAASNRPLPHLEGSDVVAIIGHQTGGTYWAQRFISSDVGHVVLVPPFESARMNVYNDIAPGMIQPSGIANIVMMKLTPHQVVPTTRLDQIRPETLVTNSLRISPSFTPAPVTDTPGMGV